MPDSLKPTRKSTDRRKRPSKRVLEYLETEYLNRDFPEGTRLPTVRELAARLEVSAPTVHAVVQNLCREGLLSSEGGGGVFLPPRSRRPRQIRIAISHAAPEVIVENPKAMDGFETAWFQRVYGGMLYQAMAEKVSVSMVQLPCRESGAILPETLIDAVDQLDGAIILTSGFGPEVTEAYAAAQKPLISAFPEDDATTSNFVSFNLRPTLERIARAALKAGRRRFLILLRGQLASDQLHRQRLDGIMRGLRLDLHPEMRLVIHEGNGYGQAEGRRAIAEVLEGGFTPDFIYCSGDALALGVAEELSRRGCRIPEDVSLVGGSGFDLTGSPFPTLTRTVQPLEQMGRSLMELLLRRLSLGLKAMPGVYLETPLIGGATTTAEENAGMDLVQRF